MSGTGWSRRRARFTIGPRGPFSLSASREFWEGFTPAIYETRISDGGFDFAVLADATMAGELDAGMLRAMPADNTRRRLKQLPGIGDFGADLILIRGTATVDRLPLAEPRLARAVAHAYGLPTLPSNDVIENLAAAWRPFRTWVPVLVRTALEAHTHEIAHTPNPLSQV